MGRAQGQTLAAGSGAARRGTSTAAPASLNELEARHPQVSLSVSENAAGLVLSMIRTEQRGQGLASAALADLCAYADRACLTIALTPEPVGQGGLSKPKLTAWYRKRGFEP